MGEPIKLPDGRIAYGQAQAAKMLTDQGAKAQSWIMPRSGVEVTMGENPVIAKKLLADEVAEANQGPQDGQGVAIAPEPLPSMPTDWRQVKGVSDEINDALHYMNLKTPADVLNFATMTGGDLTAIPGIGKARAAAIVKWAEDQL